MIAVDVDTGEWTAFGDGTSERGVRFADLG